MKLFPTIGFLALALLCLPAHAQGLAALKIENAYAFATASTQKNGAAFLSVINTGETSADIIGASSPVAATVELHTMSMDQGVMRMRRTPRLSVAGHNRLELSPGGNHIMLLGLKASLKVGESFPLTLLVPGGEISTTVQIIAPGTKPAGSSAVPDHPGQ
jgi:periplasmic copper chaperone A